MEKINSVFIVFLVVILVATAFGAGERPELDESLSDADGSDVPDDGYVDVPTWDIGNSWTYHQDYWANETDPDAILQEMYLDEQFTYTVSEIESVEVNGVKTPVYNVTIEGEVFGGDGVAETRMGTLHYEVESGETGGYMLYRMDDLGVLVDHRYKEMEMSLRDYDMEMDTYTELTKRHELGIENYDFPLDPGRNFWGNTTTYSDGYSNVVVGDFDETREHEDVEYLSKNIRVSEEPVEDNIYEVTEEISGDDEGSIVRHYDGEVKRYREFVQDLEVVDIRKTLEDYEVSPETNSLSIEPPNAYVGQTVTLNGSFPDHPDEEFEVIMPLADIQRSVQTDPTGSFTLDLEVPDAPDNTPAFGTVGSHGVIARSEEDPFEAYQVATLSILAPEALYPPSNPHPLDGAENVHLGPTLEVEVEHVKRLPMDVTFYDASDDSEIGVDEEVESGEIASVDWPGRNEQTEYEWYAEVDDGSITKESDTWSFITGEEGAIYHELSIEVEGEGVTTPPEGIHRYSYGEEVTIQADPDEGWDFIEWTGDYSGTENETAIVMDQDHRLTARFEIDMRFEVEILSPDPNERFNESDEIPVEYKVTNTRDENITGDVILKIDGEEVEVNNDLTLGAGEEFYGNFTVVEEESGRYNFEVVSEGGSDSLVVRVDSIPSWWESLLLTVGIAMINNCLLTILLVLLGIFVVIFLAVRRWKKRSKAREEALEKEEILSAIHKNKQEVEKHLNKLQDKFKEAEELPVDVSQEKDMFADSKFYYHYMKVDETDLESLKKAKSDLIFLNSYMDDLESSLDFNLLNGLEAMKEKDIQEIEHLLRELEDKIVLAEEEGKEITDLQAELDRIKLALLGPEEVEEKPSDLHDAEQLEEKPSRLESVERKIYDVRNLMSSARKKGSDISEERGLLKEGVSRYEEGKYKKAEDLLSRCKSQLDSKLSEERTEEESEEDLFEEEEAEEAMEEEAEEEEPEEEVPEEKSEEDLFEEEEPEEEAEEKPAQELTKEEVIEELEQVKGIGTSVAELLYENGYRSIRDIRKASEEDLQEVQGIGPTLSGMIMESVEEMK